MISITQPSGNILLAKLALLQLVNFCPVNPYWPRPVLKSMSVGSIVQLSGAALLNEALRWCWKTPFQLPKLFWDFWKKVAAFLLYILRFSLPRCLGWLCSLTTRETTWSFGALIFVTQKHVIKQILVSKCMEKLNKYIESQLLNYQPNY